MGQYSKALEDFNRASYLSPNNADIYFNIGITKGGLNDNSGAVDAFNNAIRLRPDFELAFLYRGTNRGANDKKGAVDDFNHCLVLNPNDSEAYLNRGAIKFDEGDKVGACLDFQKALSLGNKRATDVIKENCK
jgi:tetratricopeptide (TPR) repeat protein